MRSRKMMDYFEDYYRDSPEMNALMNTEAALLNQAGFDIRDVFAQAAIQTATWMIPVYEEIFALEPDPDDTLEFRRKRLLAYQRLRSPTTRKEFKNYLQPFVDTVEIIEHFADYMVEFIFTGEDINFKEINRMLRRAMPAHLGWFLVLKWYQQMIIRHRTQNYMFVEPHQSAWNFGEARRIRWDGEFALDGSFRWDGILAGHGYRTQQKHRVEMDFFVEAYQHNYALVNILDGRFCWDGSHNLSGARLTRLPLLAVEAELFMEAKHNWRRKYYSANMIHMESKQKSAPKNKIESMIQMDCRHKSDYRVINLWDGSFCLDGSHALDGSRVLDTGNITHRATIERFDGTEVEQL